MTHRLATVHTSQRDRRQKGQIRDPNTFRAQYLENGL